MAYAFKQSGFESYDVHINSIKNNEINLNQFEGIVACGGFSYGDVLGAGRGWSSKILHNPYLKDNLEKFFSDKNKFALGICNGCQMFSQLKSIIPGSDHWPIFIKNQSRQFEARLSRVKINKSKSLFLNGMTGSFLPIVVSHGEGKTYFQNKKNINSAIMSYVDDKNKTTENYPANPNGSKLGGNGFCNTDGRVTILMPHPERLYSISQYSYISDKWEVSPWSKFFINARNWLN